MKFRSVISISERRERKKEEGMELKLRKNAKEGKKGKNWRQGKRINTWVN